MDQNDQRDYAEEAANRQIDRDEVVDFADFEYQVDADLSVDGEPIERVTQHELDSILNHANLVHFIDGDDVVKTVRADSTIAVVLPGNIVYAISIGYIHELLNKINQI